MRIRCGECGKEFQKRTKKEAENALRMHVGRVHGNIKNTHGHARTRTDAQQDATRSKETHQDALEANSYELKRTETNRRELTEEQKEARRAYQRDRRARLKLEVDKPRKLAVTQNGNAVDLHFCPNCGKDLDRLAIAMMAANKV
jgi:hypothetical protein